MTTMGNGNAPEQAVDQQQVVTDLLALGKKNGRLTLKEIADALGQLDMESDDIDKLYETLESMGIEIETEGVLEKALPLLEPKMSPCGVILCESALDEALPPKVGAFQIKKEYRYGKIKLTAYRIPEQNATEE